MSLDPSEQPIRRARVVYSRRATLQHPPSPPHGHHQQRPAYKSCTPPPQPRTPSPSPSIHASDSDHSHGPTAAFQFGFRNRLKELDAQFDDANAPPSKSAPSPSGRANDIVPQCATIGTTVLSGEARRSSPDSPASLSPPLAPFHATSPRASSPGTPFVHRRAKRITHPIPSDSEEGPSKASSVSPVRHPITTPHSRSSPTPPTSGDFPMASGKGKGKVPARDVLPLTFDRELPSAAQRSRKVRHSKPGRPKTKAPTKKERREAAFEASRIAATRPIEVARSQEQKYTMAAFFANYDAVTTPGTELSSDPIERFSSPADNSTRVPLRVFGAPTGLSGTSAHVGTSSQPSSPKHVKALPPVAEDSDDEMPSLASVIQQAGKQQRLQKLKQTFVQRVSTSDALGTDSEDDLLVVNDDMHTVAREEAAQRRLNKANGSPVKDITSLRRINHPSIRPAAVSPQKLSRQQLQEFAKPSFARTGKDSKSHLGQPQLNCAMIADHRQGQQETSKQQRAEWVQRGGKLPQDVGDGGTQISLTQTLAVYAQQGLKAARDGVMSMDEESEAESDKDYTPDPRGSASPEPMVADEDTEGPEVLQALGDDDDDDDASVAPLKPSKSRQRRRGMVLGSDDEEEQPVHHDLPTVQRDATSSMESQTEDENDKENSAKLMYDRSEDKENKAVVRHESSSSNLSFESGPGSQRSVENGTHDSPKGTVRSPLKDISKDEDDLFLSVPSTKSPFTERPLRTVAISPPRASVSMLSLGSPPILRSGGASRINRLSLDSENDENVSSGFKLPEPSFLERLHRRASPEPSLASIKPVPGGGFSQLFSDEDQCSNKPATREESDGLSLTLDVGLKPALDISGTLKRKAETIFEKEQEYVVAAALQQKDKPKEQLYVNDHGFLTQTRPEGSSPHRMTPSQASRFTGTQVLSTQTNQLSARAPLRTLSFTVPRELPSEPQPLRRLHRRSSSPLEHHGLEQSSDSPAKLDAFSILGKAPKAPMKGQKGKHQKSEFVAVEAEESDEDDVFGFGGRKKQDDEEEEDNEPDKDLDGLVDNAAMTAETEAAHLVQEKYREHEEEDDQRLQQLHQDAVDGKFRMKRRDRGVGFEDDSDEDDDDEARRIRQRMPKKRKIDGDSLEALGQNEETKAFYNTYHQDLIDEDDQFAHLQEDVAMHALGDETRVEEPEERETVSVDEIRQRVRDMAQNNYEVEMLDPEDTSWIDRSMMIDTDDALPVKVVEHRRSKPTVRRSNVDQVDFGAELAKRHEESQQERTQLECWAKNSRHRHRGTGRSGNSAAVTSHTKAKTGGGSLRSTHSNAHEPRKTIQKAPSLLSTVSSRKDKFA